MQLAGLKLLGRERLWLWLLLAPTLLGLLLGAFGSVLASIFISLLNWDLISPPTWAGLKNYLDLPGDEQFLKSLRITAQFALMYVPAVITLSLCVALLLNRRIRGVGFFRVLFFLPVISSSVAIGLLWTWIYAKDNGLLNYVITAFGGEPVRWLSPKIILYSVTIVNVWGAIGEGMIIFLAGLQAVPKDYYEAAKLDGANGFQRLFNITLPLIAPSIFFQAVISTINALQAFEYVYILTRTSGGGSNMPTMVFTIYRNGFNYFRMGQASAQALVLAVIIFILTLIYFRLQRRWTV
jgi:multiple sugar transport system permease protein